MSPARRRRRATQRRRRAGLTPPTHSSAKSTHGTCPHFVEIARAGLRREYGHVPRFALFE